MSIKFMTTMAALAGMGMLEGVYHKPFRGDDDDFPRRRKPNNKYDLTPEQVEAMKDMTAKEKKKYLKGLGKF